MEGKKKVQLRVQDWVRLHFQAPNLTAPLACNTHHYTQDKVGAV